MGSYLKRLLYYEIIMFSLIFPVGTVKYDKHI